MTDTNTEMNFHDELDRYEAGIKEDLDTAHKLYERVKDSDNEKLKEHAQCAVELGERSAARIGIIRHHNDWNPTSEKLLKEALEDNTGCRENIRAVKKILGE